MKEKLLRLTPIEEHILVEDRPNYPCWIIVKFHFSGRFERAPMQGALDQTLVRNPLLRSVVKRQGRRLFWQEQMAWKLPIEWLPESSLGTWPEWPTLDLFKEPGFRVLIAESESRTEMIFHVHHAIFDGKALRDVCHEILSFYSISKGKPVAIAEYKHVNLPRRNCMGGSWVERLKLLPIQILGILITLLFIKRKIAPLALEPRPLAQTSLPPDFPTLVSRRLPETMFRKLRDEAMTLKVTVNDLLIRDLFFSIGKWRKWKDEGSPEDWVRMVMPVDMRKPVDRFLSAANVTSIVSLDRRKRSLRNRERLLRQAHHDMNWIKHRDIRYTFWTFLNICRLIPNGIARNSSREGCQGTIIFGNHCQLISRSKLINTQRKIEVPGALLEDITMISPLRPGTSAAFMIGTYAGNLLIDLHYDPRYHTEAQAEELLQIFIDQLNRYEGRPRSVEKDGASEAVSS